MSNDKRLEFIQAAIGRLSTQGFYIKGWSLTLATALIGISIRETDSAYLMVAFVPAFAFWVLDGYYLGLERRFVDMYNDSVDTPPKLGVIDPDQYCSLKNSVICGIFSPPIALLHITIIGLLGITIYSGVASGG